MLLARSTRLSVPTGHPSSAGSDRGVDLDHGCCDIAVRERGRGSATLWASRAARCVGHGRPIRLIWNRPRRHAPADPRLERDRRSPSRRPSSSTTRRCGTGCSRRRWAPTIDEKLRILHLIDTLGIETADIGLPGAGPARRPRRRAAGARDRGPAAARRGQLRGADARRRHPADRRDLAARRHADRVLHVHRVEPAAAVRRRMGHRSAARADRRGDHVCGARGPAGHVRDRRHDPRRPGHAAAALFDRHPGRRGARVHRRHRRSRDAGRGGGGRAVRRAGRRGVRRRRRHRLARPSRPRLRGGQLARRARGRRDAAARRRRSASASASATRRWTCCSSTSC